jgi:CDGSH-type Zn-finger protein
MSDPVIAQIGPYEIELRGTYRYSWCACGRSDFQPFCNGMHSETNGAFAPLVFTANKDETVYLCGCKHTKTPPICDGSHNRLKVGD